MIGICNNYICAAFSSGHYAIPESNLIVPAKQSFIVFNKSVTVMFDCVRRINEQKIACTGLID